MSTTRVKFTDAHRYPEHGSNVGTAAEGLKGGNWALWRGRPITVCLPPEPPNERWHCGTPYVWLVAPESLDELGFPHYRFCVCVHQIQAD
jgi:hypothetical protein